jgi:hypothetical protein
MSVFDVFHALLLLHTLTLRPTSLSLPPHPLAHITVSASSQNETAFTRHPPHPRGIRHSASLR